MWRWLTQVESMGRSLSAYAPLVLVDKVCTYGRVVLLAWLIGTHEFGVWQLGVMVFGVASKLMTLGSNHAVSRYVSYYQTQGQLREFFHWASRGVLLLGLALLGAAVAALAIFWLIFGADRPVPRLNLSAGLLALGLVNGLLMALYLNLQSFLRALRTFRLLAVTDLGYSLLFTLLALMGGALTGSGYAILSAHAAALLAGLVAGTLAAARCARQPLAAVSAPAVDHAVPVGEEENAAALEIVSPARFVAPGPINPRTVMGKLLSYGMVAMAGALLWEGGSQISLFCINYYGLGTDAVGVYGAYRALCQPVWVIGSVIWALVLSHVANHWETGRRDEALRMSSMTYKAVVLALTSLTMLILVSSPLWSRLLGQSFHADIAMLAGLLMYFQCCTNLGLAGNMARLQERPAVTTLILVLAVLLNLALAMWWVPGASSSGLAGAARAAGWSMYAAVAAGTVYLLFSGLKLDIASHFLALTPAILALPMWWASAVWLAVLLATGLTNLVLSPWEKRELSRYVTGLIRVRRD